MRDERIIKKYPNRRLYDTKSSQYITLGDVRSLVVDNMNIKVVDAKSGKDLTHSTLLQIIAEQEDKESPLLSKNLLMLLIRLYGSPLQGTVSRYLEQSLFFFMEQQQALKQKLNTVIHNTPLSFVSDIADKNLKLWKSVQQRLLSGQDKK